MEGDEAGVGALIGKQVLDYIEGTRYLVIERCVQCPINSTINGTHICLSMLKNTGECSDTIPDWCPLPRLDAPSTSPTGKSGDGSSAQGREPEAEHEVGGQQTECPNCSTRLHNFPYADGKYCPECGYGTGKP